MSKTGEKEGIKQVAVESELPQRTMLRPDEVASFFSVSEKTVRRWFKLGLLEGIMVRRCLRITRDSVMNLFTKSQSGI
jgi:excisionase family DNA binding protein